MRPCLSRVALVGAPTKRSTGETMATIAFRGARSGSATIFFFTDGQASKNRFARSKINGFHPERIGGGAIVYWFGAPSRADRQRVADCF